MAEAKKRRVRNPETFRQKALKASEDNERPKRDSGAKRILARAFGPVFRRIGRGLAKLGRLKPFRLLGKVLLPGYLRSSWRELRLVKWPSRRESRQLTFAVLLFAAIFGVLIAVVDLGLDKVFRNILLK